MSHFRGSTLSSGPWLLDCPALKGDVAGPVMDQGHKRDCGALAGEGCNHRGYSAEVEHGIHDQRSLAWAKLTDDERRELYRAWKVAETLRKAK